jgi:hypothetical protein
VRVIFPEPRGGKSKFLSIITGLDLMNGVFKWHPHTHDFTLNIAPTPRSITAGKQDFEIFD